MMCEYAKQYYKVPADIGRLVKVGGKPGIIAEDRGHYIGVNFDDDDPGVINNCHPTDNVEYLGMGKVRKLPAKKRKAKERYQRYLEYSDCYHFESFLDFLRWDEEQRRVV